MATKTPTRPKRTPVTKNGDYAHAIVPHYLDYPEEIEAETEAVRVAANNLDAARAAYGDAARKYEKAKQTDRVAAVSASPTPTTPTAPALKSVRDELAGAEQAAIDKISLAVKQQSRAITPPVAADWRTRLDPQIREVSDEIRGKLLEVGDLIATRDNMIALDRALEDVEAGGQYRLNLGSADYEQRKVRKRADDMRKLQRSGQRSATLPNDVPILLAALTADADRWELQQEAKRHHKRIGEIVQDVRAQNLPAAQRVGEITRRLEAEGIPVPHGIGLA